MNATITAKELDASHVGERIRFAIIDHRREIYTVITAELRQIHHNGTGTTINVGIGAEGEHTLGHDDPVTIGPAQAWNDAEALVWNTRGQAQ